MTLHAMHVKAEKPHISRRFGLWMCYYLGRCTWGKSAQEAYAGWFDFYHDDTGSRR